MKKMIKQIFFLIIFSVTYSCLSMHPLIIKDQAGATVIFTDTQTVQDLKSLSNVFAQSTIQLTPHGYEIKTNLTKQQLNFLLQLLKNKDNILEALFKNLITLNNLTRQEIDTLGLSQAHQSFFQNIILLETKDNIYVPVHINELAFFSTISDMAKDFPTSFIVPIPNINHKPLLAAFNLIYNLELPTKKLSYLEWYQLKLKIMQKIASLPAADLFALIETAYYLGAPSYVLNALYDLYKMHFSVAAWIIEEASRPYLTKIKTILNLEYPSIESLLKAQAINFYFIDTITEPDTDTTYQIVKIFGPQVTRLKGIASIPSINNCKAIDIRNTAITLIETDDLDNLTHIEKITFAYNKQLTVLEKNCFKLPSLLQLIFIRNNILSLTENIFQLPNLTNLIFEHNNMQIIKPNWAITLKSLQDLTLNEPTLQGVESGWINGLVALKKLTISRLMKQILQTSMQISAQARGIELYLLG